MTRYQSSETLSFRDRSTSPRCEIARSVPFNKIDRSLNGRVTLVRKSQSSQELGGGETRGSLEVEDEPSDWKSAQARSRQVMWKVPYRRYLHVFLLPCNFPIHAGCRIIKCESAGVRPVVRIVLTSAESAGLMEEYSRQCLTSARMRETVDLKYSKGTRRYT